MYRYPFVILFLYLLVALSSCSKKPLHTSKILEPADANYQPGSVEWIDKMQYNGKAKVSYGIFNDEEHLVVRMMTNDRSTITKIFAAGLALSIDTTGKKTSHFVVKYPLPQGMPKMDRMRGQENAGQFQNQEDRMGGEMMNRFRPALNQIDLLGFSDDELDNAVLNSRSGSGITAWIKMDSMGTLNYEVRLPLVELFPAGHSPNTQFSVGFESGPLDVSAPARNENRMSMDGPPEGGRSGGGRPGGGGRPDDADREVRMAQMQSISTPIDFWVNRIAFKN
jgi:hypothetical protein